jgi:hypothetical protein
VCCIEQILWNDVPTLSTALFNLSKEEWFEVIMAILRNRIRNKRAPKMLTQVRGEMAKPRITASVRANAGTSEVVKNTPPPKTRILELQPVSALEFSGPKKLALSVTFGSILKEVERLKRLSGRLDLLADEHPTLTEALLPVSASIVRIATVLELVVISGSVG